MNLDMDIEKYNEISLEIDQVVEGMTTGEQDYHHIKLGLQFRVLLHDYNWPQDVFHIPEHEMKALQKAGFTAENLEHQIPVWLNAWDNFNLAAANDYQKSQFEREATAVREAMLVHMPHHPVNSRLHRWTVEIYDREKKTFDYDQMHKMQ